MRASNMTVIVIVGLAAILTTSPSLAEQYDLVYSSYLGHSGDDRPGDLAVDSQGNIYLVGWTTSSNFPTTPGAYDRTFNGGTWDTFVVKLDPNGNLVWSTLLGGPQNDRMVSIALDSQGYVYVAGGAGRNVPTTPGAFQPGFNGINIPKYGDQNGLIVKLKPDGSDVVWASYWGTSPGIRDLDIGPNDDVYVIEGFNPALGQTPPPASWFTNAFQSSPQGNEDMLVARVRSDGSQVVWATYLGGSRDDSISGSLAVDGAGNVYVATMTQSTDIPTPNGNDRTYNGEGTSYGGDTYLAKLAPDGSRLLWGTYLGGSDSDAAVGKHALAVDSAGTVYVSSFTNSSDFPTTAGAFQTNFASASGSGTDWAIAKFSASGSLLASTYLGGRDGDGGEGIAIDTNGNVYLAGNTRSSNFPTSTGAFQSTHAGGQDGVLVKLSSDLTQLLYSSYMGTGARDVFRAVGTDASGNFYMSGETESNSWPTWNPFQATNGGAIDTTVVRFAPSGSSQNPPAAPQNLRRTDQK